MVPLSIKGGCNFFSRSQKLEKMKVSFIFAAFASITSAIRPPRARLGRPANKV